MRMMQPNELSVVDVRPLPDSMSRLAEHGGDSLIQVSSSTGPSPGLDNTFFDRYDPAPSSIVLEDLGHPDVPPLRLPPVPPGCPLLRRCKINLYGWGRNALTFCRMSVEEFNLLEKNDWLGGAAFEVLLHAIARKCGDEVEE